jgi:hypothetical protein
MLFKQDKYRFATVPEKKNLIKFLGKIIQTPTIQYPTVHLATFLQTTRKKLPPIFPPSLPLEIISIIVKPSLPSSITNLLSQQISSRATNVTDLPGEHGSLVQAIFLAA